MTPVPAEQLLSVTLNAGQWNIILKLLDQAPHHEASPVFSDLVRRLQEAQLRLTQTTNTEEAA